VSGESGVRMYSTLSRTREALSPTADGHVRIYACGPTVYGRIHVGNARPFVVFSVLKRYLTRQGLRVTFVSNLTDVNDKIYAAALRESVPSGELAERYGRAYVEDTSRLGLGRPDAEPKVTETMPQILALIETLIERGLAYAAPNGDVYYRVARFPGYGKLSGRRVDELEPSEPPEGKEDPLDFALWKANKPDEDTWWDSPWGRGRPGWHIECSAMAEALLGRRFEIHGGGLDLVFPHHENEIAQTEGASGEQLAQIWMHNEMLELAGDKMSKSEGNIALLADVLDAWPAETLIAFFLRSHYRSKLPFDDERLGEADAACRRLSNAVQALDRAIEAPGEGHDAALAAAQMDAHTRFFAALDDDFGTPGAFAALFDLVRAANQAVEGGARPAAGQLREVRRELVDLLDVLGLAGLAAPAAAPGEVVSMAHERDEARRAGDYARADELRGQMRARGWEVRDTPEGPQLSPGNPGDGGPPS
jgi:cysteinyl-tRNA synthetase